MKLVPIIKEKYEDYRLDALFSAYKWDPQFTDNNTVARYALVLSKAEADELSALTDSLTAETLAAESALNRDLTQIEPLALPKQIKKLLPKMANYAPENHVRLMRFDFHPIAGGGYAVSELNSDVPGGFAEASLLNKLAIRYLPDGQYSYIDFGEKLTDAIIRKTKKGGTVALVHCTSYSDDRQVMQFLGDRLEKKGFSVVYMAADHLKFEDGKAVSILNGKEGGIDFIFRFTPLEWLIGIKPKTWTGYFDTVTPSCNHPVAVYAQTKRFPLVFDGLESAGVQLPVWRRLLPETLNVDDAKDKDGFIFKPANGRVGEGISIKSACADGEYEKILKAVKRRKSDFVAQKMFDSLPLLSPDGDEFHVCIGVYSVEDKSSGFYARISKTRRIDSNAADIPVLIEGD